MNLSDAATLARGLMNQHGLGHIHFEFDRGKRRLGRTSFGTCKLGNRVVSSWVVKISLSSYWTEACDEAEVRDTILHEIAHALAGYEAGHGYMWKMKAREVGCSSTRCAEPSPEAKARVAELAPAAWIGVCPNNSEHTLSMHRAPGRVRSCSKCSRTFSMDAIFNWFKNGQKVSHTKISAKYAAEWMRVHNQPVVVKHQTSTVNLNDFLKS